MRKVKPGDPLVIRAADWNRFVDAALFVKGVGQGTAGQWGRALADRDVMPVRNASGGDLDRFAVLGIDGMVIGPGDNPDEFKGRPAFSGVVPAAGSHEGRFVILQGPLAAGAIGLGLVAGASPVKVDVQDAAHRFAEIGDGQAGHLVSGEAGSAVILWKESGTGVKWAVVRLGTPPAAQGLVSGWTGIDRVLDEVYDVTVPPGGGYATLDGRDWRGRSCWVSVDLYEGTPAASEPDKWVPANADQRVRHVRTGPTWDADADEAGDVDLYAFTVTQAGLVIQEDTGHVRLWWCGDANEHRFQLHVVIRATAAYAAPAHQPITVSP